MFKKYRKQNLIASAVILLPILVGLILWKALPDRFATHWGFDGSADGWSGKAYAIFAHPLILLALHWFCFWITSLDPKAQNQTKKAFGMIFWICPTISLASSATIYALALEAEFSIGSFLLSGMALLFIAVGNYLPKCKQNYTMGIKVPWALHNEENWNATHRFSGRLWVCGGALMLALSFIPSDWAFGALTVVIMGMAVAPVLYSWKYYKKQQKAGIVDTEITKEQKRDVAILKGTSIFVAVVFLLVLFLLFSGHIRFLWDSDSLTLDPTYWNSLTIHYDEIEAIEYREGNVDGSRTWGVGSFRLLLGAFENEEFGNHTRYTYYKPEACIILTVKGKTLVISGADAAETQAIYAELNARMEG